VSTVSDEVQGRHGWLRQVRIIQGGMGVAISGWRLARAVASHRACMGVVSGPALDSVTAARARGQNASAETCTHYLALTAEVYDREDGCVYVMSPPLRDEATKGRMWAGLARGEVCAVTSDDASYSAEAKALGKDSFDRIANGVPGKGMPSFKLDPTEVTGVVAYIRNFNAVLSGVPQEVDLVDDGWTTLVGKMMEIFRSGRAGALDRPG